MAIANFFYSNGLPFHAADSAATSSFRKVVAAVQAAPLGYVPPDMETPEWLRRAFASHRER